jgi:hypothetical protein
MSTTNEKPGGPPAVITPADIERRLIDAEAQVASCTAEHQRAAFEAEIGADGAEERLVIAAHRLQEAKGRVATLQSALVVARQEEERARRRIQAKLRKDNIAKIAASLERRDEAAERLAAGLKMAADAWRELLEHSAKAVLPVPGIEFPHGSMTGTGELRRAVEREMFRVGSTPERHGTDFPGANAHDISVRENPGAIEPLAEVVKGASHYVNATLQGEELEAVS